MYENGTRCTRYTRCTRCTRYEMEGIWDSTVFAKESEAGHFLAGDLPLWCDNRSTWEPALAVRPLEAEQRLYLDQPTTTSPPTAHDGLTSMAQLIQATTAPSPPPFKPQLLVARTDKWLSTIQPTWVKGRQLSTIWVRSQPEWRVVSHRRYKCENDRCGRWLVWLMTCGQWPVWSMTCVVNDLCGWWPVWSPSNSMHPWPRW